MSITLRERIDAVNQSLHTTANSLSNNLAFKGVDASPNLGLEKLSEKVLDIEQGQGPVKKWTPHPDWWKIDEIFDNDIAPSGYIKCAIVLLIDSDVVISLSASLGGNYYKTSDGYEGPSINWYPDITKDKPCSDGYSTRYVIIYRSASISTLSMSSYRTVQSIWIIVDNCMITSISIGSSSSSSANQVIERVEFRDNIILSSTSTYIFGYCYSLQSVIFPKSLIALPGGSSLFYSCYSLWHVVLPENLESIPNQCFYNSGLSEINLPESVQLLGTSVFQNCTALKTVVLHNGIKEIPTGTFSGCTALSKIILPPNLEIISSNAFNNCNSLLEINLPNSVKEIRLNALTNIYSIKSITLPSNLSIFENSTISTWYGLRSINISPNYLPPSNGLVVNTSARLSISSMINLANNLADNTGNAAIPMTLRPNNINKLTDEEKAIFTNKNYTLS